MLSFLLSSFSLSCLWRHGAGGGFFVVQTQSQHCPLFLHWIQVQMWPKQLHISLFVSAWFESEAWDSSAFLLPFTHQKSKLSVSSSSESECWSKIKFFPSCWFLRGKFSFVLFSPFLLFRSRPLRVLVLESWKRELHWSRPQPRGLP